MQINGRFHPLLLHAYEQLVDKQFAEPILQSGSVKSLQRKMVQWNDVTDRAPVKPQMRDDRSENVMETWRFCLLPV